MMLHDLERERDGVDAFECWYSGSNESVCLRHDERSILPYVPGRRSDVEVVHECRRRRRLLRMTPSVDDSSSQ